MCIRDSFDEMQIVYLYSGFNSDDLFYFYPASSFNDPNFSPYQREWFYKANDTLGEVQITDPYEDAIDSSLWLIAFSRSIEVDGRALGVGSLDIMFDTLKDIYSNSILGESGYELLVSKNGIVFGAPKSWATDQIVLRIDEETITGITSELWEEIQKEESDKAIMSFTEPNGDTYWYA